MPHMHRLEEGLTLLVGLVAKGSVVDRHLTFQDVGEKRHAMPVDNGFLAGRQCHDHGRYDGFSCCRINDVLADNGLTAG